MSRVNGGCCRTVTFSDSKNLVTRCALWADALSCKSLRRLSPVFGRTSSIFLVKYIYRTLLWMFCLLALEFAWLDPYFRRKLHTKPSLAFVFFWQQFDVSHFWWPKFSWITSTLVQKSKPRSHHQSLTCLKPFCYILDTFLEVYLDWLHRSSFVHLSTNGISILQLFS